MKDNIATERQRLCSVISNYVDELDAGVPKFNEGEVLYLAGKDGKPNKDWRETVFYVTEVTTHNETYSRVSSDKLAAKIGTYWQYGGFLVSWNRIRNGIDISSRPYYFSSDILVRGDNLPRKLKSKFYSSVMGIYMKDSAFRMIIQKDKIGSLDKPKFKEGETFSVNPGVIIRELDIPNDIEDGELDEYLDTLTPYIFNVSGVKSYGDVFDNLRMSSAELIKIGAFWHYDGELLSDTGEVIKNDACFAESILLENMKLSTGEKYE